MTTTKKVDRRRKERASFALSLAILLLATAGAAASGYIAVTAAARHVWGPFVGGAIGFAVMAAIAGGFTELARHHWKELRR